MKSGACSRHLGISVLARNFVHSRLVRKLWCLGIVDSVSFLGNALRYGFVGDSRKQ